MPNNIDRVNLEGLITNRLIDDEIKQQKKLYPDREGANDRIPGRQLAEIKIGPVSKKVLNSFKGLEPVALTKNEILEKTGLTPKQVTGSLHYLILADLVKENPGNPPKYESSGKFIA